MIPVSAQKGLRRQGQRRRGSCWQASRLPVLERRWAQGVLGQRQKILRSAVAAGIGELRAEAARIITIRRRDLAEQMLELKGLRGKNTSVIRHMRTRIEQEQAEFDVQQRARSTRCARCTCKLLREVFDLLGSTTLKADMAELTAALAPARHQAGRAQGLRRNLRPAARRPARGAEDQRRDVAVKDIRAGSEPTSGSVSRNAVIAPRHSGAGTDASALRCRTS